MKRTEAGPGTPTLSSTMTLTRNVDVDDNVDV